jgi:lipopolysaccharide transport protein LptA
MAPSALSNLCLCGFVLAFALASGAQQAGGDAQELVLESGPLAFDGQTNLFRIKAPRIRQGDLYIAADDAVATGVEFDAGSEWRFTGNVRIEAGAAVMNADSAVFTFEKERLARGELSGAPASFTHLDPERQKPLSGTANHMSYDSVARTMRMTGNVLLQRDQIEVQGCDIIYNLTTEGFSSGDSDCENPFRLRRVVPGSGQQTDPAARQ